MIKYVNLTLFGLFCENYFACSLRSLTLRNFFFKEEMKEELIKKSGNRFSLLNVSFSLISLIYVCVHISACAGWKECAGNEEVAGFLFLN